MTLIHFFYTIKVLSAEQKWRLSYKQPQVGFVLHEILKSFHTAGITTLQKQ